MGYISNIEEYLDKSLVVANILVGLNAEIYDSNLILSDLDHFLELEDLTDEELRKITELRKKTLLDRRKAKDIVSVIDQVLPKQVEGRTTADRYEFAIRKLKDRVYTPRKITLEDAIGEDK